jgi:hypothetical protein
MTFRFSLVSSTSVFGMYDREQPVAHTANASATTASMRGRAGRAGFTGDEQSAEGVGREGSERLRMVGGGNGERKRVIPQVRTTTHSSDRTRGNSQV